MPDETRNCPFCGETINIGSEKCIYCGESLNMNDFLQEQSQEFEDDPLLKVTTFSNGTMIFLAILIYAVWQPLWLYQLSKTEKNRRSFQYINETKECIPAFLPITMALVNLLATLFLAMTNSGFCFLLLIINSLILSILEIKCMSHVKEHIKKCYDVEIEYSKFWTFILQSIYMNHFFLTYKERVEKLKRYNGNRINFSIETTKKNEPKKLTKWQYVGFVILFVSIGIIMIDSLSQETTTTTTNVPDQEGISVKTNFNGLNLCNRRRVGEILERKLVERIYLYKEIDPNSNIQIQFSNPEVNQCGGQSCGCHCDGQSNDGRYWHVGYVVEEESGKYKIRITGFHPTKKETLEERGFE